MGCRNARRGAELFLLGKGIEQVEVLMVTIKEERRPRHGLELRKLFQLLVQGGIVPEQTKVTEDDNEVIPCEHLSLGEIPGNELLHFKDSMGVPRQKNHRSAPLPFPVRIYPVLEKTTPLYPRGL